MKTNAVVTGMGKPAWKIARLTLTQSNSDLDVFILVLLRKAVISNSYCNKKRFATY